MWGGMICLSFEIPVCQGSSRVVQGDEPKVREEHRRSQRGIGETLAGHHSFSTHTPFTTSGNVLITNCFVLDLLMKRGNFSRNQFFTGFKLETRRIEMQRKFRRLSLGVGI